ncbi:glycosyltransferase family 2 protein [Candidatus Gracilibacteria bacterium]|nr:glycosyltransferase family 2 protein [Candidatus Gracilibacteria bacterium]
MKETIFKNIFSNQKIISKIPFLLFLLIFITPIILIKINYKLGLFFIAFYISYWVIKAFESYYFILSSYIKLLNVNSRDYLKTDAIKYSAKDIQHVIIIPFYNEPYDVIEDNVLGILHNNYPYKENITILLAAEKRGKNAENIAKKLVEKYKDSEIKICAFIHPDGLQDEAKVKGANITYAIKEYINKNKYLNDKLTFVTTIDADTRIEKNFFLITTYFFLTTDYPDNAIYQFTPVYSNNWIKGTFFARLIAIGTTFWQLAESQNPEFYRNFAVYGMSLHCLKKSDFWSKTSIVEDGIQYWRSYFAFDSMFRIINVPAVCKMDVVEEENIFRTIKSQYKQLRRWSWGCSDIDFVIPNFIKNKKIKLWEKIRKTIYLLLNHLFWASGPIMLFLIGYIPGFFENLQNSIVSLAVSLSISIIFTWVFATIAFPSFISILIMKKYVHFRKRDYFFNIFQWILIPFLYPTLFSIPAIESQFRYFINKRIDYFQSTEKMSRK